MQSPPPHLSDAVLRAACHSPFSGFPLTESGRVFIPSTPNKQQNFWIPLFPFPRSDYAPLLIQACSRTRAPRTTRPPPPTSPPRSGAACRGWPPPPRRCPGRHPRTPNGGDLCEYYCLRNVSLVCECGAQGRIKVLGAPARVGRKMSVKKLS